VLLVAEQVKVDVLRRRMLTPPGHRRFLTGRGPGSAMLLEASLAVALACGGANDGGGVQPPPPPPPPPMSPPAPIASADSVLLFDQGHYNYHRLQTTYVAFAREATREGWIIEPVPGEITAAWLARGRVLVIAGALSVVNQHPNSWRLPTPSAFSAVEIDALRQWVSDGGGLLLIADHMPFAGAAMDVAEAFGARFSNGFAFDRTQLLYPSQCLQSTEVQVFSRTAGTLGDHIVTADVQSIATFTGAAFEFAGTFAGTPILTFPSSSVSVEPATAWVFTGAPERSVSGWLQGAVADVGSGRVAIFGEAAMFSEQTCSAATAMGMNHPLAAHNVRLLRNLLRWLGGRPP
jgi:hypothetical protein